MRHSKKKKRAKAHTFAAKVASIEARGVPHDHARAIAGATVQHGKGRKTKAERERERRALKRAKALHDGLRR
jgi:hypothetical protein